MEEAPRMIKDGVFTPAFDALVSAALKRRHIPGLSIAVIDDQTVFAKGYGHSRLPDEDVTPDTLFHCASMTKAFTATAVSLLVDDDEKYPDVKWTAPVSSLIRDDFVLSDGRTDEVTVEDLLSHRTGLPNHDDACYGSDAKVPDTPKSVTRKLRHLPLNYPLRTKWQYSNYMYTVSAHLVESLTGQWLGSFLRERIWEPLNMKDTYYGNEDLRSRRGMSGLAKGYGWDDEAQDSFEIPWPFQPEGSGAGEMISSALDYAEFLRCMIHKTLPISQDGHAELVKPRMLTGEEMRPFVSPGTYALGWERYDYHGEAVVGHDGSVDGFCSKMVYLPRLEWGLVVFGNSQNAYPTEERMCWTLIDELLGVPVEKRFGWDKDEEDSDGEEKSKSKEELYPSLPDISIPLTMPLSAYVGAYHHPGFGTFEVEVKDGKLQVNGTDRTWKIMLYLEHVSGEYFIAKLFSVNTRDKDTFRAQFRVGTDGVVGEFGVEIVNNMENEKIWFRRG